MGKDGISTRHVVKLEDSTNYQQWRLQVQLILEAAEVWSVVIPTAQPPEETGELQKWNKKDVEARAIIVPTLSKRQMSHIYSISTAKEMWKKLKDVNSDDSTLNKQQTLSKFLNYRIKTGDSPVTAYLEIEELARNLEEMGERQNKATVITKIVSSLPDNPFEAFKRAWDSVPEDSQSMEMLLARLRKLELDHKIVVDRKLENKQVAFSSNTRMAKLSKDGQKNTGQKKDVVCFKCNKTGHFARDCRSAEPKGNTPKAHQRKPAFMANGSNQQDIWYSDSGAVQHITGRKDWITQYKPFSDRRTVALTDQSEVIALGHGTVEIEAYISNQWIPVEIENVLYIPGAVNLFSEGVMARKGYVIYRDDKGASYSHIDGSEGPRAEIIDNMYVMKFRNNLKKALSTTNSRQWHERLGHINMDYLKKTVNSEAVTGIKPQEVLQKVDCEECHYGKETKKPYPQGQQHNYKPGEFVHADLSGKMRISSIGGAKYFLLFKDDATGFRMVQFLKRKLEVPEVIKQVIAFLETQTGTKVRIFKSDNGTEFVNKANEEYFRQKGILQQTIAPYNPQSNGKIEREMRTIKDTARTMLTNQPEFLWAEAVATSVYIHNRVLDKQSGDKTAYEQVFGHKPNISHIRKFGSTAYSHIPREHRHTWEPKAEKFKLVGYDGSRNYRLYDPETRQIVIRRNVSFKEDEDKYVKIQFQQKDEEKMKEDLEQKVEQEMEENSDIEIHSTESESDSDQKGIDDEPEIDLTITDIDSEPEPGSTQESSSTPSPPSRIPLLRDRKTLTKPARYQTLSAQLMEPTKFQEAISNNNSREWVTAMEEEIKSLHQNNTWDIVERPKDRKTIGCKWVFKIKRNPDNTVSRYKARLVALGYRQQFGIDFSETFAAVSRFESIRLLLAIAAMTCMKIKQFDIKTAFLHGNLTEDIYMEQPDGFSDGNPDNVCKLKKSIYGLKQSPRCWKMKISEILATFGFHQTQNEPNIYVGHRNEEPIFRTL